MSKSKLNFREGIWIYTAILLYKTVNIAILCNTKSSEYPNRPELISDLIKDGNTVFFGAIYDGSINEYYLEHSNCHYMPIIANRSNVNPIIELQSLNNVRKQIKKHNIDVVIIYGVKNHSAMAIGSRMGKAKSIICVVNGSGNLFIISGLKGNLIRLMSFPILKFAYFLSDFVCFQNRDDEKLFEERRLINRKKTFLTNGSGVNLQLFPFCEISPKCNFLFLSRITPSKGIYEYIEAAKIVKKRYPKAVFDVVGPIDSAVEKSCLSGIEQAEKEGVIRYHGASDNVNYWLANCRFFVYPSYHEGTPRCVLQAMSVGRPILTTDAPGCRTTVEDGKNGFLVPIKDNTILADRMIYLIENPICAEKMGLESRHIAEKKFDVHKINDKLIYYINTIGGKKHESL